MPFLDAAVDETADFIIARALRLALFVDSTRKRAKRGLKRFRGSLAKLQRRWLWKTGRSVHGFRRPRRVMPHNRTPEHLEREVVRLHVEQPQLGTGQLRWLAERVLGFSAARETIRRILRRRRDLIAAFEKERRRKPKRIEIHRPRELWALDHRLVLVLGFFPVWLLGVVDYKGSKLLTLGRCRPTTAVTCELLAKAFERYGVPERILSDNGPAFVSGAFEAFLAERGIRHSRIRPGHPWTSGRIERIFRTFKEIVFARIWLFSGVAQIDRFCTDFIQFYNRDRPHSAYGGRTPDEMYFDRKLHRRPLGRVAYFDGALSWYRFG